MKIFVKIVITLVLILVSLIGLSRLYEFALFQNANIKSSYIQKEKINADVLIHGPCEPLWMVSPKILDKQTGLKSYNLALSHSDFADNYLHLYLYLKNNVPPKLLFLYVTPESMDEKYNTFNTYRFSGFMSDSTVARVVAECDSNYYKWIDFPFMKFAYYGNKINFNALQGMKHYFENKNKPHFEDGYEPPVQVVWDNHLEEFIKLYPNGYNFMWSKHREKYLIKTILLAKQYGIQVYLYESPVFKESINYQPNRAIILQKIDSIAKANEVKSVRFSDMKIAESRAYYMSTLNTNIKGSEIFTDSLGKFIYNEIKNNRN